MNRESDEGTFLGIAAFIAGIGWVWFCYWLGVQNGEEWTEYVAESWCLVGGGVLVIGLGFLGWTTGGRELKRPSAWLGLIGILLVFAALWWVFMYCLIGAYFGDRWAILSLIGWCLAAYGLNLLSPLD